MIPVQTIAPVKGMPAGGTDGLALKHPNGGLSKGGALMAAGLLPEIAENVVASLNKAVPECARPAG
jgi:hypothetical protein